MQVFCIHHLLSQAKFLIGELNVCILNIQFGIGLSDVIHISIEKIPTQIQSGIGSLGLIEKKKSNFILLSIVVVARIYIELRPELRTSSFIGIF